MKFKLYAVFIKWAIWIIFLFMRGQDIVNNWDFPSKIPRHCHKRLVPKIVFWHHQPQIFVKLALPDRLKFLVDFAGMILFCLLPLQNYFFRACYPTLFAADLNTFLPLITSPISGAADSNMSATAFCRWDNIFTQKRTCSSPSNLCDSRKSPSPLSSNPSILWNFYLPWSNLLVVSYVLEMNVGHLSKHQNEPSETNRYKGYILTRCVAQIDVDAMKRIYEQKSKP